MGLCAGGLQGGRKEGEVTQRDTLTISGGYVRLCMCLCVFVWRWKVRFEIKKYMWRGKKWRRVRFGEVKADESERILRQGEENE